MPRGPSLQLNEHESHTSVISHKCHHTDSWSLDRFQTAVHCCRGRRYYLGSPCPASQGQPGTFRGGEGKKKTQQVKFRVCISGSGWNLFSHCKKMLERQEICLVGLPWAVASWQGLEVSQIARALLPSQATLSASHKWVSVSRTWSDAGVIFMLSNQFNCFHQ